MIYRPDSLSAFYPWRCSAGLTACSAAPSAPHIQTLEPGVVKIAVISTTLTDQLDPEQWIYRYANHLARDLDVRVEWLVVPLDKSGELAGKDVVATNLASFPDRASPGGTFLVRFRYEQGALRIRAADRTQFRTIADFVGKKVGAVKGMAAERDLLKRAPSGVQVVSTMSFPELYEQFAKGLDGRVNPSYEPELALIDHHDLNPGQREESVFVVREKSTRLLDAVSAFVKRTPFPSTGRAEARMLDSYSRWTRLA